MRRDLAIADAMIDLFKVHYKEKMKAEVKIDRAKAKWPFTDILKEFSRTEIEKVIEFYFKANKNYDIFEFLSNFFDYHEGMKTAAEAEKRRAALREETRKRVEAWQTPQISQKSP